jgi:hypothetical protein
MKYFHAAEEKVPDTHRRQEVIDKIERKWLQMSDAEKKKNVLSLRNPSVAKKLAPDELISPLSYRESDFTVIEGMLVLYGVNDRGGLRRITETELKMGRKFKESRNGNMMLTRSKNKKLISLVNFDLLDRN